MARARRKAFVDPPARRNRVWQTDFSEPETAVWQLDGVVGYAAKVALACPVTPTKAWRDAVGVLEDARDRAGELLDRPLLEDCTDPDTGELTPVIVVSDNGACYRATGFARHIAARPEFAHVRSRHKAPETNGVVERFFQAAKYEHLYRHDIDDGQALAEHVKRYWPSTTKFAPTKPWISPCHWTATCARRASARAACRSGRADDQAHQFKRANLSHFFTRDSCRSSSSCCCRGS